MFDFKLENPFYDFEEAMKIVPALDPCKDSLRNRLLEYGRLYHNIYHCATMWRLHCHYSLKFNKPCFSVLDSDIRVASAICFHDAIYDAKSKTNEADSASLWLSCSTSSKGTRDWVNSAILATSDHLGERKGETLCDDLREWFVGLDLASLAAPWDVFVLNNRLIRLEYGHVSDDDWIAGNGKFLKSLLDSPYIYRDIDLRSVFEENARNNIRRHLGTTN